MTRAAARRSQRQTQIDEPPADSVSCGCDEFVRALLGVDASSWAGAVPQLGDAARHERLGENRVLVHDPLL